VSDLRRLARFEWTQSSYSLLDRSAERELLPLCADQHIGFTAFSPLAGGWLTGKYRSGHYPDGSRMTLRPEPYLHLATDRVFAGLDALAAAARERGVTMEALALAWVLQHPQVDAAILGPRTPAQLASAVAALAIRLSVDEAAALALLW
jgi:aryl-alcohol dehydrogenase-like predicted oxidoreductase